MTTAQDLRYQLRDIVRAALPESGEVGWSVTTASHPDIACTYQAQIGHAITILPDVLGAGALGVLLTVTLWVNEGNDGEAATELYAQLARVPGSLLYVLWTTRNIEVQQVGNVGLRDDGPTDFLAGDIAVVMHGRA